MFWGFGSYTQCLFFWALLLWLFICKYKMKNKDYFEHIAEYGKPISVRLNAEERQILDKLKKRLGTDKDSTALKASMHMAENVLQLLLPDEIRNRLFKNDS